MKEENNFGIFQAIALFIAIILLAIYVQSIQKEHFDITHVTNAPCYYYVTNDSIKLFGVNDSGSHDVRVVTNFNKTRIQLYDFITDPATEIPRCEYEVLDIDTYPCVALKDNKCWGDIISIKWLDQNCDNLNQTYKCGNYVIKQK